MDSLLGEKLIKKKDIVKKGPNRFKDLNRLLKNKFLTTFYSIINNIQFITTFKALINSKANSYLFISKIFL